MPPTLIKIRKERPALNVTNEAKHLSHAPPITAVGSLTFLIDGGKWVRVSKASPTLEAHTCYAGGNTTKKERRNESYKADHHGDTCSYCMGSCDSGGDDAIRQVY